MKKKILGLILIALPFLILLGWVISEGMFWDLMLIVGISSLIGGLIMFGIYLFVSDK